jgi:hypothetical protein
MNTETALKAFKMTPDQQHLLELTLTPEEHALAEWCALTLTKDEIFSCEAKATQLATDELRADDASDLLVRTMKEVIVRHVRAIRFEKTRQHAASKTCRKSRTRDHNE